MSQGDGTTPEGRFDLGDSRYLDGRGTPEERAAFRAGLEKDPARRARLEAHEEAMDLWRADVARDVDRIDPEAIAAEVLEQIQRPAARPPRLAIHRVWAAAAVVLIALGAVGTFLAQPPDPTETQADFRAIDESLIEAFVDAPETWLQEDGGRGS